MLTPDTILQNRYLIVRAIGQGGMGAVYLAKDQRLGSDVALKETFFKDERLRKAFEREARLLASLRHPALPKVIDHFSEADGQFLVMEFIPGDDLLDLMNSKGAGFPPGQVLNWADQLLDALDYMHTRQPQIIHRDIKPQNLKLMARNQIVLLDFGLAKGTLPQMSRITAGSSVLGYTPHYAPLEQMQGAGTDPRSDLYSLAATLYHLATGYTPHDALARAAAVVEGEPDPLVPANEVNPQVLPAVAAVLMRAMALKRDHRPATAADMRLALQNARRTATIAGSGGPTEIAQPAQGEVFPGEPTGQPAPPKPFVTQPLGALSPARTTLEATPKQPTSPVEEVAKAPSMTKSMTKSRRPMFIWLASGLAVILLGCVLALSGVFRGIIPGSNIAPAQTQNPSPSSDQSDQTSPDPATSIDSASITPFPPTPTEIQPTDPPTPAEKPAPPEKTEKSEKPGNVAKEQEKPPPQLNNSIGNFRIVNVSDTEILVKVDYTYTGGRGPDRIFLSAYPLPRIESDGTSGYYPSPVKVGAGSASVRIRMIPNKGDFTSTSIQVCMYVGGGGTFYCQTFPYRKVWKPTAPEANGCSNVDDAEITANVKDMFAKSRLAKRVLPRISVYTKDGIVTIRGTIASERAKQEATRVARQVACVKRVDNQLIVE
ncbi:MAG TPA: protein kinase [Blastocatellia bacterium]|nr:protein kinase [Blastocatellia bacterium]